MMFAMYAEHYRLSLTLRSALALWFVLRVQNGEGTVDECLDYIDRISKSKKWSSETRFNGPERDRQMIPSWDRKKMESFCWWPTWRGRKILYLDYNSAVVTPLMMQPKAMVGAFYGLATYVVITEVWTVGRLSIREQAIKGKDPRSAINLEYVDRIVKHLHRLWNSYKKAVAQGRATGEEVLWTLKKR